MSIFAHETMTNHHALSLLGQLGETLQLWRERSRARREIAQWSDRELQDIGLSRTDVAHEAEKPFWRA